MDFTPEQIEQLAPTRSAWIIITKTGHTAVWEYGGSKGQTGHCQVVAGKDGRDMTPIFVTKNCLPNAQQALFPLRKGYYLIRSFRRHNGEKEIVKTYIYRVVEIHAEKERPDADIKQVGFCWNGNWDEAGEKLIRQFPRLNEAVNVAQNKVREYQCTRPMYAKPVKEDKR